MLFVDCDLYETAKFCLEFIFPRLDEGGITMFDEYDQNFRDKKTYEKHGWEYKETIKDSHVHKGKFFDMEIWILDLEKTKK